MTKPERAGTAAPLIPDRPPLPSLREAARRAETARFVEDLRKVAARLGG